LIEAAPLRAPVIHRTPADKLSRSADPPAFSATTSFSVSAPLNVKERRQLDRLLQKLALHAGAPHE